MNNFYDQEREGRAAYQLGDSNCVDCGQTICACESLADWHRERDNNFRGEPLVGGGSDTLVRVECLHAFATEGSTPSTSDQSFDQWLDSRGDALEQPESFTQWLNQTGDAI